MTIRDPGYPWKFSRGLSPNEVREIVRETRKQIRVDTRTMQMRETSGGILLSAKPPASADGRLQWFRVLTDQQAYDGGHDSENKLRCRDTMNCPGNRDDAPSIWAVPYDLTNATDCTVADENPAVLLYFPKKRAMCSLESGNAAECENDKYHNLKLLGFFNAQGERWETDDEYIGNWDQVDFVRFCGGREPVVICGAGCPDDENPEEENRACCLFDGMLKRDLESCDYTCGGDNTAEDVWIVCNDVLSLPGTQDCFPARRIDDDFTITYCPFGATGPTIQETRPVYSIGCCGCGCPKDKLYIEMWAVINDGGGEEMIDCPDLNGKKITVNLTEIAPLGNGTRRYEGYFCRTYTVPRYVAQLNNIADPTDIYVEVDLVTGQAVGDYWIDSGDAGVAGGACYLPEISGTYVATCADKTGFYDVLKQYVSGGSGPGDPQICNPLFTTARFCYKVTVDCLDGDVAAFMELAIPPGHPVYTGTPLADPYAELVGLETIGGQEVFVNANVGCDGRNWYRITDPVFGRVNILTANDGLGNPLIANPNNYCGWPHYMQHVFGGCCWDHAWEGTSGLYPVTSNYCSCCFTEGSPTYEGCQSGGACNLAFIVKMSWNCANDGTF